MPGAAGAGAFQHVAVASAVGSEAAFEFLHAAEIDRTRLVGGVCHHVLEASADLAMLVPWLVGGDFFIFAPLQGSLLSSG